MPARASAEWRGGVRSGAGEFTAGDSISGGAAHAENAKANCPVSRALAGAPEVNLATLDTATNAS